MTFCNPVSIQPKLWSLALYYNTLTKDSFCGRGILQLLRPDQASLVEVLGKQSGRDVNKAEICKQIGMEWKSVRDSDEPPLSVLPNCALYMEMKQWKPDSVVEAGDHQVFLCRVLRTGTWNHSESCIDWQKETDAPLPPMDEQQVLYTGLLRQKGIL